MTARSLNLLRHPGRRLVPEYTLVRSLVLAGWVGALAGGLWSGWRHVQLSQLQEQRAQLQIRREAQIRQQADLAADHERATLHRQLLERASDWQARREQLLRLHRTLNALADDPGLRVERWQGDGRRLVLQARLSRPASVPQLMAGLSATWPSDWRLQSLGDRGSAKGDAGVDVTLEASWPGTSQGNGPSRP